MVKRSLAEEKVMVAERQYERMIKNLHKGIVDRMEIAMAMDSINAAHRVCLAEGRRDLIK